MDGDHAALLLSSPLLHSAGWVTCAVLTLTPPLSSHSSLKRNLRRGTQAHGFCSGASLDWASKQLLRNRKSRSVCKGRYHSGSSGRFFLRRSQTFSTRSKKAKRSSSRRRLAASPKVQRVRPPLRPLRSCPPTGLRSSGEGGRTSAGVAAARRKQE